MKEKKKLINFLVVGVFLTLFDFIVYNLVLSFWLEGKIELAAMISGAIATILAYILHGRITWKERDPGKLGVLKFLGWNLAMVVAIRPILAFSIKLMVPIFDFGNMIIRWLGLPFSYEFVEKTGVFVLMTAVIMILNFTVYEFLVFGGETGGGKQEGKGEKIKMNSIRKTREEIKSE